MILLLLVACAACLDPPQEAWLMAVLQAPPGSRSPADHQVRLLSSEDGQHWAQERSLQPYTGSVPDLARREDTLYLFTPHQVRSRELGQRRWSEPEALVVEDGERRLVAYDPSVVVDEQGRLVLFFLEHEGEGDPATCGLGLSSCTKRFLSATEVEGSQGRRFTRDPGVRLELEVPSRRVSSDPEVFHDGRSWALAWQGLGAMRYARADTLRGTYVPRGQLTRQMSVPALVSDGESVWIYGHRAQRGGKSRVSRAVLPDLDHAPIPRGALEDVLNADQLPEGGDWHIASPAVLCLADPEPASL